ATATNVMITNALPAQAVYLSASEGGRFHANQVAWLLGNLEPGTSRTVELTMRVGVAGEFCNRAAVFADQVKAEAELCTMFQGVAAVLREVGATGDRVELGGETIYTIVVVNQGTEPATNIRIKALVPAEMTVVRAKGPTAPPEKLPLAGAEGQTVVYE